MDAPDRGYERQMPLLQKAVPTQVPGRVWHEDVGYKVILGPC
jgi:hypothetical protein